MAGLKPTFVNCMMSYLHPVITLLCLLLPITKAVQVCFCSAIYLLHIPIQYTNSATGSNDAPPTNRIDPCHYDSCRPEGAQYGHATWNPRLNWVNSYPVTSMRYGIDKFMPALLGVKHPDLAVSGINVDPNVAQAIPVSGTVGAATFATHERAIPAVAFSGWGNRTGWNEPRPPSSKLHAAASVKLVNYLAKGGRPYLPSDTWLNVNFPHYNSTSCSKASDVKFVLTTLGGYEAPSSPGGTGDSDNAEACESLQLPTELSIVLGQGCYASVSVGNAGTKKDASPSIQRQVMNKLDGLLSQPPDV